MRTRPPFERVQIGITVGWAVILLGAVGLFVVSGWSEPKFGGVFAAVIGAMLGGVGAAVLGVVTAIARWGLIGSAARTLLLILAPPLIVAALLFLPGALNPPRHTTSTGPTIGHVPSGVESSVPRLSDGANFDGFADEGGGELWIGVRLVPNYLADAEIVERSGRSFLIDADAAYTRIAEIVDGVQLEVQSNYLSTEALLEVAEGLTYRREFDWYRRQRDPS